MGSWIRRCWVSRFRGARAAPIVRQVPKHLFLCCLPRRIDECAGCQGPGNKSVRRSHLLSSAVSLEPIR